MGIRRVFYVLVVFFTYDIIINSHPFDIRQSWNNVSFITQAFNLSLQTIAAISNNFTFNKIPADKVTFIHFSPLDQSQNVLTQNSNLSHHMDLTKPMKLIFHGWTDNGSLPWIQRMARQYHTFHAPVNVIAVDWSSIAAENYLIAATAVHSVGCNVAEFILKNLRDHPGEIKGVHAVGHSLGAHAAGFFGKCLFKMGGVRVGRITGLDAANPLFELPPLPSALRLAHTDADFVDLMHTNKGMDGVMFAYGDMDCFINKGGPYQPFCKIIFKDPYFAGACSHQSVHEFYADTIKNPDFLVFEGVGLNNKKKGARCGESATIATLGSYDVKSNATYLFKLENEEMVDLN